jgi:lipopolysaccharide transport system ATP-binding protein
MSDIAIKVENLSKAYQLGQIGTGTVSNDIHRWWSTKIRGKEDPFLKIGETNDRSVKGESNVVWSLKDINFEINQGDAVGIIGKNGAGKSTLLKLLSRVTAPTTGNIKAKGRIASLLEVGTGFHPELTGRENIYLNGAILGMRKKEIARKFDEIVDFSGVERYIDTPVKRYSSGMYVRLAFAVAAHLESEILIVDEVLAVGDVEFQKKCLGKMGEISKGEGRTVLFVSHNLGAVQSLCSRSIMLENGQVKFDDATKFVIDKYLNLGKRINYKSDKIGIIIKHVSISNNGTFQYQEQINISISVLNNIKLPGLFLSLRVEKAGIPVFTDEVGVFQEVESFNCKIPPEFLVPGEYGISIAVHIPNVRLFDLVEELGFSILESGSKLKKYSGKDYGAVNIDVLKSI